MDFKGHDLQILLNQIDSPLEKLIFILLNFRCQNFQEFMTVLNSHFSICSTYFKGTELLQLYMKHSNSSSIE